MGVVKVSIQINFPNKTVCESVQAIIFWQFHLKSWFNCNLQYNFEKAIKWLTKQGSLLLTHSFLEGSKHCTLYIKQFTLHTALHTSKFHTEHSPLYIKHLILHTAHYTSDIEHWTSNVSHCTQHNIYFNLNTAQYTINISYCTLHTNFSVHSA